MAVFKLFLSFLCTLGVLLCMQQVQVGSFNVKVAGGGLAGLSTVYHLLEVLSRDESFGSSKITVYDADGPGQGGASKVCAGLLHCFTPRGGIIHAGAEGMLESLKLLQIAQRAIGPDAAVYRTDVSVLRPCYNEESLLGWKNAAQKYPDMLEAISSEDFKGKLEVNLNDEDEAIFSPSPSLSALPVAVGAMSMSNVYVVDAPVYMLGLWKAIQEMSTDSNCKVEWVSKNVDDLDVLLADSDAVVLCSGAGSQKLWSNADPESAKLPFNYVRGQNLIYDGKDLPEIAVLSGEYVVPIQDKLVCGATHEFGQLEDLLIQGPDLEKAESLLGDKASSLFPQLQSRSPISANTGIRVSSQRTQLGRLPIISRNRLNSKVWMFTGLGSRGLIHHAVVGKYLANAVIKKDEGVIPSEFVRNL